MLKGGGKNGTASVYNSAQTGVTVSARRVSSRRVSSAEMRFLHAQKGKALEIGSRPIHMRLMV